MQRLIFEQGSNKKKNGVGFLDIPNRFSLLRKPRFLSYAQSYENRNNTNKFKRFGRKKN
jgi:hypothetical protein